MNYTETLVNAARGTKATTAMSRSSSESSFAHAATVARASTQESRELSLSRTRRIDVDKAQLRERRIYIDDPDDKEAAVATSVYRNLRTHVLRTMYELSARSLMVTGTTQGVGKTLTAINLAINIARHARKTAMLVDLDLRDPSIHYYFDFESEADILDVAEGRHTLEQTLITPGVERLSILPGKGCYENSSELLSWPPLQEIIREITSRYEERIVIFDAPPVLGCDDVAVLAPMVDACLLVVEEGGTNRDEFKQSMRRIRGIPLAGIVLNKSRQKRLDQYYY
jgi:capsular exopolysaccharide synthesis family protein